jgi:CHASE3 domain sensor protein
MDSTPNRPSHLGLPGWIRELAPRRRLRFMTYLLVGSMVALLGCIGLLVRELGAERFELEARQQLNARIRSAATVLDLLNDAETGQRGFLLTGKPRYLAPYKHAVQQLPPFLNELHAQLDNDPALNTHLRQLDALTQRKLAELADTVHLAESGNREAAVALVQTDSGQTYMENARSEAGRILGALVAQRNAIAAQAHKSSVSVTRWGILSASVLLFAILIVWQQLRTLFDSLTGSEERFRLMTVHSQDVITTADESGHWNYVSPAVERLVGFRPDELHRKQRFDFIHPDDGHVLRNQLSSGEGDRSCQT